MVSAVSAAVVDPVGRKANWSVKSSFSWGSIICMHVCMHVCMYVFLSMYLCICLLSASELLAKVKMSLEPPFRPNLPDMEGHIAAEWIGLARNCWQTSPYKRPTFRTVKSILLAHHSGK